jgi:hypothetical protein
MSKLDKAAREALPESDFAVPRTRQLPIHDEHHTRLAWTQLDRTQGLTGDEKRIAKERIKRRAQTLGIDTADWHITAHVAFVEAMALEVPTVDGHPNRMPFKGVLTRLDQPSDMPPGGASGKRTILPTEVARSALPSLLGMAVDYTPDFDGHDRRSKIGIITAADIVGDAVEIEGFLYAKDFPEECRRIRAEKDALGFSYELDARIQDADADFWVIAHCVFTGAAVLYKDLAAYTTTSLAAQAEGIDMTLEELQAAVTAAVKPLSDKIDAQGVKIAEIEAKGASLAGPIIDQVRPHVDAVNACASAMEAAGVGTDGKAGHAGVLRKVAAHMAAEAVSGRVPMIYRDHDYLPDARVEAAGVSAEALAAAVTKAVAPLQEELKSANTTIADLKAAAFKGSPEPQRQTISPAIQTLLAKGGIKAEDMKDGKLSLTQVDAMLDAAGIKGTKAIETKLKLRHDGVLADTAA